MERVDVAECAVVRGWAARLLEALESQSTVAVRAEYADVAGTVARVRSLVLSAVAMVDADSTAAIGLVARAVFEEWLFGMLMVFGEAQDRVGLDGDYQYWLERHSLAFGHDAPGAALWRDPETMERGGPGSATRRAPGQQCRV